ncbi:MAG: hypothetical protein ABSD27_00715 [Bryobacteraceae bacterium]
MILIELVYEEGCPHVAAARANLAWAFVEARVSQRWTEWNRAWPAAPARARGCTSPTILINGRNVMDGPPDASRRLLAVPSVLLLVAALRAAAAASPDVPRRGRRRGRAR